MKKIYFAITAVLLLVLDQWTKHLALENLPYGGTKEVLGNFFRLSLTKNPGGVFGTRIGGTNVYIIFAFVGIVLIFIYLLSVLKRGELKSIFGLGFIMAGAIGNLIDRIRFGKVTDFLDFGIGDLRWATFNIADSVILIGLGLLLIAEWKNESSSKGTGGVSSDKVGSLSGTSGDTAVQVEDPETDKREADTGNG